MVVQPLLTVPCGRDSANEAIMQSGDSKPYPFTKLRAHAIPYPRSISHATRCLFSTFRRFPSCSRQPEPEQGRVNAATTAVQDNKNDTNLAEFDGLSCVDGATHTSESR